MTMLYINEYLDGIIEILQDKYNLSPTDAQEMLVNSAIYRMIFNDADYIMHYDIEDWADEIISGKVMA